MDPSPAAASTHVIVVTGASDGIGAELARQWAERRGAALGLVLAARSVDKLEQVAAQCRAHGARVHVQRCDVSRPDDCRALVEATVTTFGGIDTLVNNAGMSAHARFEDVTDLAWTEELMRIKRGAWSLEQVKSEAERLFAGVEPARQVSPLPDRPDEAAANALLMDLHARILGLRAPSSA